MRKKNILIIWLAFFSLLLIQCTNDESLYQKLIDDGETVYLGKTDSLIAMSGIGRIKLKWHINADPKIEETVIYWNMRQDSIVKPFHRTEKGIQADSVLIDGLPEGTHIFELYNKGKEGSSLFSSVQGEVYGDSYISTLANRMITSINVVSYDQETQLSDLEISWGAILNSSLGSQISYYDRTVGKYVKVFVPADSTRTTITNVGNRLNHSDDMLDVTTLYHSENNIDTLETFSRKEQVSVFTASGTLTEYNGNGIVTTTTQYNDLIKTLRRVINLAADAYDCDRVANASKSPDMLFRLTIQDSDVSIDGFFNGRTITGVEQNLFFPEEQRLDLHYMYLKDNGEYAIVEEEYLFPSTNIPVPLEKQPPANVFDAKGLTVKNLFTFYNDLVIVEPSVGGGAMRFFQYDNADGSFSKYRGTLWGGWDIFKWSISYIDAIIACTHDGNLTWYSWDKNTGNVIANLGILGSGFHNYRAVIPSIDHQGLFCVTNEGRMLFFPILGVNSLGTSIEMTTGWDAFIQILSYESGILAIDDEGGMWLFPVDTDKKVGEKIKVGSGWNKYNHITVFGTDLLARGLDGIVWKYKFDKELFWDVTNN